MKTVDAFLDTKIDLFGIELRVIDVFFFSVLLGLGLSMRIGLFEYESGDYISFLEVWIRECRNAGGFPYLGIEPGITDKSTINYGCMYQYVIILAYYFSGIMKEHYFLKLISVIFDVICAVSVMRIAYLVTEGDRKKAIMAFGAMMFLPTSVLNSGAWAQCDSIYTAFVLLSLLHLMKGNNKRLFIYLALAYSFKQQAIFIVPFLIIMWLKGRVKLRYIYWIPVVLVATDIPALIAGRDPIRLLKIYLSQVVTYTKLTMNYPSIYTVVSSQLARDYRKLIISVGTMAAVALLGAIAYYIRDKKYEINGINMVTLVIFTVEVCLFTLPVMHERYGYLPEILSVVYAVTGYKRMVVCAVLQMISLVTYSKFLFGSTVGELWPLTIGLFAVIVVVGKDLYLQVNAQETEHA